MSYNASRRSFLHATGSSLAALGLQCFAGTSIAAGLPFEQYAELDAVGLANRIRLGEISPMEALNAAIDRTNAVNKNIAALVGDLNVLYDQAKRAIKRGLPDGPLTGVPFLLKDISFAMRDVEFTLGSKLYAGANAKKAIADSTAVQRYRKAGLVVFGRTHSPEFGIMPTTESALYGITRNPWNLERTAGGSSGGTAAAVASGIAPAGSGSDGGGSIRIPASCCGLFGLKPSRERIPSDLPEYGGIVSLHVLTRTVRDSAAFLDAARGPNPGLTSYPPKHNGTYLSEIPRPPRRLRIGVITENPRQGKFDPDCVEAVRVGARQCESLGHEVEDVTNRFAAIWSWDELLSAQVTLFVSGLSARINRRMADLGRKLTPQDVEPGTYNLLTSNEFQFSAADLAAAHRISTSASRRIAIFTQDYDVLLTSTLGKPPIKHGVLTTRNEKVDVGEIVSFIPITFVANITGVPAMSVPLHWNAQNLPIGVHFFGRYGDEATLLRLAAQLEQAKPWKDNRPPEKNLVGEC